MRPTGTKLSLDATAFATLLAAVFVMAFAGVGAGRALLGLATLLTLADAIRRRERLPFPPVAWLAWLFAGFAAGVTLLGPESARGAEDLHKLIPLLLIPIVIRLVSSPSRFYTVWVAYACGMGILVVRTLSSVIPLAHEAWQNGARFDLSKSLTSMYTHTHLPKDDIISVLVNAGDMQDGQRLLTGIILTLCLLGGVAGRRRWAAWGSLLAAQIIALVLTFKRGAWICAILFGTGTGMALCARPRAWTRAAAQWLRRHPAAVTLTLIALVCALLTPPARNTIANRITVCHEAALTRAERGGRSAMWFKAAPALIRQHPWGIGFKRLTPEHLRAVAPQIERGYNHVHSNILQVLIATGWPGLLIYAAWMATALMEGLRGIQYASRSGGVPFPLALAVLMMMLALMTAGLAEYQWGAGQIVLIYILLFGMAAAARRLGEGAGPAQKGTP